MAARKTSSAVFASYNIHKCVGTDRRFDPDRVMAVIAEIGADVIALQEADRRFGDKAGLLDLPTLERDAGLVPVPVTNDHRGHGWHGNLVLVREGAVRDIRQIRLPGLEPRGALVADLDLSVGPVRVVAAHLGLLRHSRLLQVETLLAHAGDDRRPPGRDDGRPQRVAAAAALGAEALRTGLRAARPGGAELPGLLPGAGARPGHGATAGYRRAYRGARHAAGAAGVGPPAGPRGDPARRRSRGNAGVVPELPRCASC